MTTRRRLVVDGFALRLHESADRVASDTPTYVLIHGVGMSHRSLARLHAQLAVHARVLSVDLPGFAGLPAPARDLDIAAMGGVLGRLLAMTGVTEAILVGHSMGAQWAIETSLAAPDRVIGVVLIGPVVDDHHRSLPAQGRALAVDTLRESLAANAIVFTDYIRCGIRWYLRQVRHMVEYPTQERLRRSSVPVLLVRGGDDAVAGADWCRRLGDAAMVDLVELAGHAHNVQHSAPAAVGAAVSAWAAGLLAKGPTPMRPRNGRASSAR
ncbi:alpha/beta fold hydrolase [Microbacterium sp. H83]|uniref:alpha/beta fold hydrolase n=1 Tax=Microbacterium sp. H83 TaxID=1827324 RepID=UPI000834DCC2|nr:alpha/beta fold hydrolase [Microbacterium sp. H83]